MPSFADFDLNKDGRITEEEFNEARAARIADRAQKGYPMRGMGNAATFADIDTNRDGTLSPAEFATHQAAHRQQMMGR
jgi:Ca2+-binding EF-hand superfamily protein